MQFEVFVDWHRLIIGLKQIKKFFAMQQFLPVLSYTIHCVVFQTTLVKC